MATQVFETTFKSGKVNYKFNIGLHALPASIKGVDTLLFVACIIVNMGNPLFKNAILGKSKKFILFDKHEGIYRLFDTSDSIEPAVVLEGPPTKEQLQDCFFVDEVISE
jgi:hypothetical protein